MTNWSLQVTVPSSFLLILLLQRNLWVCHEFSTRLWRVNFYRGNAVPDGLGRVHERTRGMGCR